MGANMKHRGYETVLWRKKTPFACKADQVQQQMVMLWKSWTTRLENFDAAGFCFEWKFCFYSPIMNVVFFPMFCGL